MLMIPVPAHINIKGQELSAPGKGASSNILDDINQFTFPKNRVGIIFAKYLTGNKKDNGPQAIKSLRSCSAYSGHGTGSDIVTSKALLNFSRTDNSTCNESSCTVSINFS